MISPATDSKISSFVNSFLVSFSCFTSLQHDAKEALEKVCGKKAETKEVQHMTLEGMEKELKENAKHQMEYVNSLKQNTMNSRA